MVSNRFAMTRARGMGPLPLFLAREGSACLERVFSRVGLPVDIARHGEMFMPLSCMIDLFEAAAQDLGEDFLGLDVGRSMPAEDYGLWVRYAASAPSLKVALSRVGRTVWAQQSGAEFCLKAGATHTIWLYRNALTGRHAGRHHSDHVLFPMIQFVRGFLGPDWLPDWVEVEYSGDTPADKAEEMFGVRFKFDKPGNGFAIRNSELKARRRHELLCADTVTISEILADTAEACNGTDLDAISNAVTLRLLEGKSDLDGLASSFRVSKRTLQREIDRNGATYQKILERARLGRAVQLISETDHDVGEIAFSLGYAEPSNFARAFRAWTDLSPRVFRGRFGRNPVERGRAVS